MAWTQNCRATSPSGKGSKTDPCPDHRITVARRVEEATCYRSKHGLMCQPTKALALTDCDRAAGVV
jgi:hypothetical protein